MDEDERDNVGAPGGRPAAAPGGLMGPQDAAVDPLESSSAFPSAALKGAWAAEEDAMLLKAIEANGSQKWSYIASHLPGRTGKQCRERWHNQLNPAIDKSPWTESEDRIILSEYARAGPRWADIAAVLTGRTDNAVKNRWNCSMRRKIEQFIAEELDSGAAAAVSDSDGAVPLLLDPDRLERAVQRVRKLPAHTGKKRAATDDPSSSSSSNSSASSSTGRVLPPKKQRMAAHAKQASMMMLMMHNQGSSSSTGAQKQQDDDMDDDDMDDDSPCPESTTGGSPSLSAAAAAAAAAAPPPPPPNPPPAAAVGGGAAPTTTSALGPASQRGAKVSAEGGDNRPCYCRASRCLKLYCDCFATGTVCDGCCCVGCQNNSQHEAARQDAIATALRKNPAAFDMKVLSGGCNCKRSRCLKKYCECFEAHVRCGISCACESCENFDGSTKVKPTEPKHPATDGRSPTQPTTEILDAARGISMLLAHADQRPSTSSSAASSFSSSQSPKGTASQESSVEEDRQPTPPSPPKTPVVSERRPNNRPPPEAKEEQKQQPQQRAAPACSLTEGEQAGALTLLTSFVTAREVTDSSALVVDRKKLLSA